MKKTEIIHLGKTFKTVHFSSITDKECEKIKEDFYKKPNFQLVSGQFEKLLRGGVRTNYIVDYYLKDVMSKARLDTSKWSIEEFFNCNDLIRFAYGKIKNCSNFYKAEDSDIKNIKTVLRLSPSGTAGKVSNFPYKTMLEVFQKYNINNNYYDFSCGWGIRLLSSMSTKINYFGTDPNEELVDSLKLMADHYQTNMLERTSVDIRCLGSQEHVKEWDGKIGLAFSSPPYFDLEHYNSDNQSIKDVSYDEWLNGYWRGTVENVDKYLIEGGHFLLNMKNIKKHNTLDDMCKIIEEKGFKFVENLELKNINRVILEKHGKNTNEVIAVFKKG